MRVETDKYYDIVNGIDCPIMEEFAVGEEHEVHVRYTCDLCNYLNDWLYTDGESTICGDCGHVFGMFRNNSIYFKEEPEISKTFKVVTLRW